MEAKLLRKVQMTQLEIMDDIHRVCNENNLQYYIIGGTALGAVRHHGFIPWDVDIDIAMPRQSYEQFVNIYSHKLNAKYTCYSLYSICQYLPPHAIVVKNGTLLKRHDKLFNTVYRPTGVFVDILPLDFCPLDEKLQKRQALLLSKIARFKMVKASIIYDENNLFQKYFKYMLRALMLPLPMRVLNIMQQKIMQMYNDLDKSYICSMSSHYSYHKQRMPYSVYGTPTLVSFEDRLYYGPNKIKEYLHYIYGDYNKIPSVEVQNMQKDYFYDALL